MNRLITFGCSFTYGQGLPGCIVGNNNDEYSTTPSDMAWPAILGKLLNCSVINNGKPGASNTEILYHILNFEFKPTDIVVVMWSLPNRDAYFVSTSKRIKPFRQLGLWSKPKSKYIASWLSNFDPVDNGVKSWISMHHADLVLKNLNLNYIHYPFSPSELNFYKPDFIGPIENLHQNGFIDIDRCVNDPHPGINSHRETAKTIFNILKNDNQ